MHFEKGGQKCFFVFFLVLVTALWGSNSVVYAVTISTVSFTEDDFGFNWKFELGTGGAFLNPTGPEGTIGTGRPGQKWLVGVEARSTEIVAARSVSLFAHIR
jgi:hypothetical protein